MTNPPNGVHRTYPSRAHHVVGPHHEGTPDGRERTWLREGFGARLRQLRTEAGLTQAALAERAGLDRVHVSRLELGRRRPEWGSVRRLVAVLVPRERRGVEMAALKRLADDSWRRWKRKGGRPVPLTLAEADAEIKRMIAKTEALRRRLHGG